MNKCSTLFWMAFRYFRSKNPKSSLSVVTGVSIAGLAIGVAALTVTLAILSGFDREYKKSILGLGAHVVVLGEHGIENSTSYLEGILHHQEVASAQRFVMGEGMVTFSGRLTGAVLKGIDPSPGWAVKELSGYLEPRLDLSRALQDDQNPSVVLGKSLAERLHVGVDDRVQIIVVRSGQPPLIVPFHVQALFYSGMHEFDNRFVYLGLQQARALFSLGERDTGLEVYLHRPEGVEKIVKDLEKEIPFPNYLVHWKELNANLFAALKLEKIVFFLVILPIVVVGALTIVAALIMFMMERQKGIAILRAIGMKRRSIAALFLMQGMMIGLTGIAIGFAMGSLINFILGNFPIISLSPQVYFIDHLPVHFIAGDYLMIGCAALFICFVATLIPALQASRLKPAETLRGR